MTKADELCALLTDLSRTQPEVFEAAMAVLIRLVDALSEAKELRHGDAELSSSR
jgi:hypothetical protein